MINNVTPLRLSWTIATCCFITACSGCKHVSTWSNVSPAISSPAVDPYGYPPSSDDGYLHRPQTAPELTPFSPLPAPGHTEPVDPPLPPAPAEGARSNSTGTGNSLLSKSKAMFNLPAMKFLQRKDSATDTVQSSAQLPAKSTTVDKPTLGTARAVPLPLSRLERVPATNSLESRPRMLPSADATESGRELLAPVVPTQQTSQTQVVGPDTAETEYTWPKITPGNQYTTGNELQAVPDPAYRREVKVENWPYSSYRAANHPNRTLKLRKPLPPASADEFKPATTPVVPPTLTVPDLPTETSAAVPPLLPPSP